MIVIQKQLSTASEPNHVLMNILCQQTEKGKVGGILGHSRIWSTRPFTGHHSISNKYTHQRYLPSSVGCILAGSLIHQYYRHVTQGINKLADLKALVHSIDKAVIYSQDESVFFAIDTLAALLTQISNNTEFRAPPSKPASSSSTPMDRAMQQVDVEKKEIRTLVVDILDRANRTFHLFTR